MNEPARGPLGVHPDNPRYFTDGSGKAVYLTGSHTWNDLKDMGPSDPPPVFDYEGFLDYLVQSNHSFFRLWTWDQTRFQVKGKVSTAVPFAWVRTGPGDALDGKPKFDLTRFDQSYFDRLRSRVQAAGKRGLYASVMLFEGWGLHGCEEPWCWNGHPFNAANNVNGVDGDPDGDGRGLEAHTLTIPKITELQELYVKRVVDTVNDLDNVLFEICNESGAYSTEWQYRMIDVVHSHEGTLAKQHPVGMTFQFSRTARGTNQALFDSPADWVSPSPDDGYGDDPPAADGSKVIVNDTDHLWGIGGNQAWVWKSFCRGMNPIFMDPFSSVSPDTADGQTVDWTSYLTKTFPLDPGWDPVRKSMGYTKDFADRMNLAAMVPHDELSSSRYCLANPGREYLVYITEGNKVTVDLSGTPDEVSIEWFDPSAGQTETGTCPGNGSRELVSPFARDTVLYVNARSAT